MIDIIIPTYKSRDTLPQALDSLIAQTKKMFIVTIVQDHDEEDYSDIVEEYRRRGLNCRVIVTPYNGGPGFARQYGMDNDQMSSHFMFLDADDMYFPRAVEILSREAQINDADIVIGNFLAEQSYTPGAVFRAKEVPCTWLHGKIYKAQYLRDNNIRFLDGMRLNEDAYFNLVAHNCTTKKFTVDEVMYLWRDNANSITRAGRESDEFFRKSWEEYIKSQVEGILKIIEITGDISAYLLAATMCNMYGHIMRAVHYGFNLTLAQHYLSRFKTNDLIQEKIDSKDFWKTVANSLKACQLINENSLIFFKQRFPEWLNQYVIKEKKDERIYR